MRTAGLTDQAILVGDASGIMDMRQNELYIHKS